ncbi:MAG: sigma-70 family RNA polymerase sigma factor [Planctomycetota bacterium]
METAGQGDQRPTPPDNDGDDSFANLLRAARAGSREASGQLIEQFRPYLLLIANEDLGAEMKGKVGASDVVQDALLSAQQTIEGFRGQSPEELRGWLRRIVLNDILETQRKYKGTEKRRVSRETALQRNTDSIASQNDPACPQMTPSTWVVAQEEAETLRRSMRQLTPEYQQVLELRNWQDLSFADIGLRMDRSPEAARKLWSRAVVSLQRILNREHTSTPEE